MRVIVLGAGEVGRHVCRALSDDADIVVVDCESQALGIAEDELDVMTLRGNATHRSVLEQAETPRADLVLALTGNDAVNVTASILAKTLGARQVVARVDDPGFYAGRQGLERDIAGIDACVCASRLICAELLRRVTSIQASFTDAFVGGSFQAAVLQVTEDSPILVRPASHGSALLRGVIRGATVRANVEVAALQSGDQVLLVGPPEGVAADAGLIAPRRGSRAVLIGGGDVGLQMARSLEGVVSDVRIIEPSRIRCEELARLLPRATILHGDGTNLPFLREERIGVAEFVLSVTGSDEVNLMASLLSRELGAKHTFALVHRPGYAPVYEQLGIEGTTSGHENLANAIRWLLPDRWVVGEAALPGIDGSLFEVRVPTGLSRAIDPRDLPLVSGALVLAVADPLTSEPRLVSAPLRGGEHVILAAASGSRRALERGLARLRSGGSSA